MRLVRFRHENDLKHGILKGNNITLLAESFFGEITESGGQVPVADVTLVAPCDPTKVVAVGLNYRDHAAELGMDLPEDPLLFMKPGTAVIGPGDGIVYPPGVTRLDYEAELAIVIRKKAKDVSYENAADFILGYTCLNDVTARDLQQKDIQFTRSKSFDTFCPIGPLIETELNPLDVAVKSYLNDKLVQDSSTSQLVFNAYELVSFISCVMTLLPGDVIATGTPHGIGPMQKGDEIVIEVAGIGSLKNKVI